MRALSLGYILAFCFFLMASSHAFADDPLEVSFDEFAEVDIPNDQLKLALANLYGPLIHSRGLFSQEQASRMNTKERSYEFANCLWERRGFKKLMDTPPLALSIEVARRVIKNNAEDNWWPEEVRYRELDAADYEFNVLFKSRNGSSSAKIMGFDPSWLFGEFRSDFVVEYLTRAGLNIGVCLTDNERPILN